MIAAGLALVLAVTVSAAAPSRPVSPPRVLPAAAGVEDPGLAVLLGLIEFDARGTFPAAEIRARAERGGAGSRLPLDELGSVIRTPPRGPGRAELVLVFRRPPAFPIPYRILAYRPGTIRGSAAVRFTEWELGEVDVRLSDGTRRTFSDVRVWGIAEGFLTLDIDGWVDALLGSRLDDTYLAGVALAREGGERVALALGYNRGGKGVTGAFDPGTDAILFPTDETHKRLGRALRLRLETLMPTVRRVRAAP